MLFPAKRIRRPDLFRPRTTFTPGQLAALYGYPTGVTKQTQWAAVISLGGGFALADIQEYCKKFNLPVPPVKFVSVLGALNQYSGNPNSADGENALDIQNVIGASGGLVGVLVYTAPNTSAGFIDAIKQALANGIACVGTISWGQDEQNWSASDRAAMDAAFRTSPIPWFAASGDDGSSDGDPGQNTDYPASSPYCIGVGGTTQVSSGETAWSYGGGGPSHIYGPLSYQKIAGNRAVPDMAANADPNTGYPIVIGNQWQTFGGTSAVGPMLAAGVALCVSLTGKRLSPAALVQAIYSGVLTDVTSGTNGAFKASAGEDYCTGMGTPNKDFWTLLIAAAGGAPPVQSPPVIPPPVIPPPVATVPTQAAVLNKINSASAAFIAAQRPMYKQLLQAQTAYIDTKVAQLWATHSANDFQALLEGTQSMLSQTTIDLINKAMTDDAALQGEKSAALAAVAKELNVSLSPASAHAGILGGGLGGILQPGSPILTGLLTLFGPLLTQLLAGLLTKQGVPAAHAEMAAKAINWGPLLQQLTQEELAVLIKLLTALGSQVGQAA